MDERLFIWPGTTYLWLHHQRKTPFPHVLNGNSLPGGLHPCEMVIGPILCKFCADNLSFMWVHGHVMPRRCLSAAQFLSSAFTAFCPLFYHTLWTLEIETSCSMWSQVLHHHVFLALWLYTFSFRAFNFCFQNSTFSDIYPIVLYYLILHFSVTSAYHNFDVLV